MSTSKLIGLYLRIHSYKQAKKRADDGVVVSNIDEMG